MDKHSVYEESALFFYKKKSILLIFIPWENEDCLSARVRDSHFKSKKDSIYLVLLPSFLYQEGKILPIKTTKKIRPRLLG